MGNTCFIQDISPPTSGVMAVFVFQRYNSRQGKGLRIVSQCDIIALYIALKYYIY